MPPDAIPLPLAHEKRQPPVLGLERNGGTPGAIRHVPLPRSSLSIRLVGDGVVASTDHLHLVVLVSAGEGIALFEAEEARRDWGVGCGIAGEDVAQERVAVGYQRDLEVGLSLG